MTWVLDRKPDRSLHTLPRARFSTEVRVQACWNLPIQSGPEAAHSKAQSLLECSISGPTGDALHQHLHGEKISSEVTSTPHSRNTVPKHWEVEGHSPPANPVLSLAHLHSAPQEHSHLGGTAVPRNSECHLSHPTIQPSPHCPDDSPFSWTVSVRLRRTYHVIFIFKK